ncbi:GNAT family N-acetyltransferase [Rufibacter glacialis]|uniref:GNAT family N-acetyltransferase n=1 Tax=Rufibacter glacialis TaxID=1259555 RepID=A0A5M8QSC3_9BACT|nr:GNAT family N-acetyltransferase [Rufibacter glacialis]KAA6437556.1 GNAT family N-acetyltransferase [Rufibacter glacialis]GGK58350.1 acetyltransferase [Rufibacter glacialis]
MTFAFAETAPLGQLCALFNAAFADYLLPMVLTEPIMELKLKRDGTNLALSPLAMEGPAPVGFIFTSLGEWKGKRTAYNGGTGVLPQARGHRLTEQMYHFCVPLLKQQGVTQCLLEVIQENTRALAVYKKLGFEVVRSLRCFRHPKADLQWHRHARPGQVSFQQVSVPNWALYKAFWEVEPSWQHHTAAIDRSAGYVHVVEAQAQGQCVGYGVIYGMTGALAQLAVAPAWRRKGIGQALVQELVNATTSPTISVINVDGRGESLLQFLQNRKAEEIPGQYEMVWAI